MGHHINIIVSLFDFKKSISTEGNNRVRPAMEAVNTNSFERVTAYVSETSVLFASCFLATTGATNNSMVIPLEILGLNELDKSGGVDTLNMKVTGSFSKTVSASTTVYGTVTFDKGDFNYITITNRGYTTNSFSVGVNGSSASLNTKYTLQNGTNTVTVSGATSSSGNVWAEFTLSKT